MGLLNNAIPFALIVWGQTLIASGLASTLNAATPIFTVVVAGILLPDERIAPLKLAGVMAGCREKNRGSPRGRTSVIESPE